MRFDVDTIKEYWDFFKIFNDGSSVFGWIIGKVDRGYDEFGGKGYLGYEDESNLFKLLLAPFKIIAVVASIIVKVLFFPVALLFAIKF